MSSVFDSNEIRPTEKIEVLVKEGVNHPDINDDHHNDETHKRMTAWLHGSHLTDYKLLDDSINDVTADIGKDKDWSISDYTELRKPPLTERNTYSNPPTSSTPKVMTPETVLKVLKYLYKKPERNILLMIYRKNKERWFWQRLTL